jgi:hypothetical protein
VKVAALVLSFGVVLSAPTALAQGVDQFGAYGMEERGQVRSGQEAAFELRIGPYRPNVDDKLQGSPYQDIFGDSQRWHAGIEIDWQVFRIPRLLSLGPGVGMAYTRSSARAPLASGTGLSAQDTTLNIIPFHLVGVLRLDVLADRFNVPLCPYAKFGLGYAMWWSKDGEETGRDADGIEAKDSSYGLVWALGVAARLDWLDPEDAANADSALGINHSALFLEYFGSDLGGFGSSDVMQVGTQTFVFGLMLEI